MQGGSTGGIKGLLESCTPVLVVLLWEKSENVVCDNNE